MLKTLSLVALLAVPAASFAAADNYAVDPMHSSVNFSIDHLGYSSAALVIVPLTACVSFEVQNLP